MPPMSDRRSPLNPRLVVADAKRAIEFYRSALGADEVACFEDEHLGKVVHAEVRIGGSVLMLTDEAPESGSLAPPTLGGSPVLLHLEVDDADDVGRRMVEGGADVLIPIDDRFYGAREGRLRDPFGHLWIISQKLRDMSDQEIQAGIDSFHDA